MDQPANFPPLGERVTARAVLVGSLDLFVREVMPNLRAEQREAAE